MQLDDSFVKILAEIRSGRVSADTLATLLESCSGDVSQNDILPTKVCILLCAA